MQRSRSGPGRTGPNVFVFLAFALLAGCGDEAIDPVEVQRVLPDPEFAAAIGVDSVSGASIETNRDDYVPGEVVHVEGRGWTPHETVRLHLTEEPDTHDDVTQDVVADEMGEFSIHLYDVTEHDLGVLFTLTATGLTSGSVAVATFADGLISGASIQMRDAACENASSSVPVGSAICAFASFQITANEFATSAQFRWVNPNGILAGVTTRSEPFPVGAGGAQTFSATFIPNIVGSWSVRLCESAGGGGSPSCSGSSERVLQTFDVTEPTNTAPKLDAIGPHSVDEGSPLAFIATASDGDSPAQTLTFSLIGAPAGAVIDATTGEFAWTPADGPATATFAVRVTDNGTPSLFAQEEITVTVDNVAPVITDIGDDAVVHVGEVFTRGGGFTDPGDDDWSSSSVDYGDGGEVQPLVLDGKSYTLSHVYTSVGSFPVTVCVRDGDEGGEHCESFGVTVLNTPPLVVAGLDATIDEGDTFVGTGSFTDPDADTWSATVDYGDDSSVQNLQLHADKTFELSHVYADDGRYTVTVCVSDGDDEHCDSLVVTVDNVAPELTELVLVDGAVVPVMQTVRITGRFRDPGARDTHTCTAIAMATDIAPVKGSLGKGAAGSCTSELVLETAGVYTVVHTVEDGDGGRGSDQRMTVVYDPSAGFVTGGGWIASPAGAWHGDAALEGRASFGFVWKYQKGSTVPSGNTELVLRAADLKFRSTEYHWLVVNPGGTSAQFRGAGTVNGQDGYSFMIWATDGPDTFRIRIWADGDEDNAIYDNGTDQSLGGGSIVIHTAGGGNWR